MAKLDEQKIKTELANRGFESVSIKSVDGDGKVSVDANKLHPIEKEGTDDLYVPLPVSLSLELGADGHIRTLAGEDPSPAAIGAARSFVRGLKQRSEIESATATNPGKATHRIEKDAQGRLVLRRGLIRR
jgi:hypothetical protein